MKFHVAVNHWGWLLTVETKSSKTTYQFADLHPLCIFMEQCAEAEQL